MRQTGTIPSDGSPLSALQHIVRKHGLKGLTQGLGSSTAWSTLKFGATFTLFKKSMHAVTQFFWATILLLNPTKRLQKARHNLKSLHKP